MMGWGTTVLLLVEGQQTEVCGNNIIGNLWKIRLLGLRFFSGT